MACKEKQINWSLDGINCSILQILNSVCVNTYGQGMWRVWGRIKVCTGCWWESLRERGHWGRPRCRWEDDIKMDLQEVGGSRGDWMELAQDTDRWRALVGTVRDFRVP